MHLSRPISWLFALVLAAATLTLPGAAWAAPACDPAVQMTSFHAGGSGFAQLPCDDPSGLGLNYAVGEAPGSGFAVVDGAGGVAYYPDWDFVGSDSFTVEVSDNEGGSTSVQVSAEVVNAAPDCADDLSATPDGDPVTVDLTAKCVDPDGDDVTVAIAGEPQHGTVELDPQGVATYTPDAGWSGDDSFSYQAADAWTDGTAGTETVTVGSAPDALEASLSVPRQTLRSAAANGVRVVAAPSRPATCEVTLTVSRKTARKLGIAPDATGPVVVGARTAEVSGRTALRVPLTRKAARAFRKATRADLLGSLEATDGDATASATARATLTNP